MTSISVKNKDLNHNLTEETNKILRFCYQCGICTSGCPISKLTDTFKPNRIGRLLFLGLQENVINDDAVWLCLMCHACDELCPQKVHFTDALMKVRNLKASSGYVPKEVLEGIQLLIKEGRKVRVTDRTQLIRKKIGLNKIPKPPINEVRKILEAAGFRFIVKE